MHAYHFSVGPLTILFETLTFIWVLVSSFFIISASLKLLTALGDFISACYLLLRSLYCTFMRNKTWNWTQHHYFLDVSKSRRLDFSRYTFYAQKLETKVLLLLMLRIV
jgi:hypothetical protein